jgi:hypothetical protein
VIETRRMMKIDKRVGLMILFVLVSFLCPIAMSPVTTANEIIGYVFLAPLLAYAYGRMTDGLTILPGIYYWSIYVPLIASLSVLFTVQVIRSIKGKTPQNRVFYVGLLSLIFPGLFLTWMNIPIFFSGLFGYAGPVPIQFAFGMKIVSNYGYYVERLEWPETE